MILLSMGRISLSDMSLSDAYHERHKNSLRVSVGVARGSGGRGRL